MRKFLYGRKGHSVRGALINRSHQLLLKNICVLLVFLALGFLLYGHILNAPFFFDDHKMILENWTIRDLGHIHEIWRVMDYPRLCFFTFITFAVNYHFGGYDPFGYHLGNVLLHIVNAFLLYRLILSLLSLSSGVEDDLRAQKSFVGIVVSAIFLAHPIQTQAVSLIWSRTEILSAFWGFLSLLLYISGRKKGRLLFFLLSCMAFFVGVFCRGNLLILPLLVLLIEISFGALSFNKIKRLLKSSWHWGLVAVCASLFGFIRLIPGVVGFLRLEAVMPESLVTVKVYFLTQLSVVLRYIQLLIVPINQNVDHFIFSSESFLAPRTLLSFAGIMGIIIAAFFLFKRKRLMAFGILWFFISLIPVSTIFVLSTVISESRLYFPSAGFSIFIAGLLFSLISSLKARRSIAILLIVILSAMTMMRNDFWRSPVKLMEDSVVKSPQHYRPHLVLGTLYAKEGRFEDAVNMFQKAIHLKPDYIAAYNNLAVIYMRRQEFGKAVKLFHQIIGIEPKYVQAYLNLGYIYIQKKEWWAAKDFLTRSIVQCGPRPEVYIGLADSYMMRGQLDNEILSSGAMENLKKALELDPRNREALFKLGQVYFMRRERDKAVSIYRDLLIQDPEDISAMVEMGKTYMSENQLEQAEDILLQAISIDPKHTHVCELLGQIYFAKKDFKKAEEYYQKARREFAEGKIPRE